MKPDKDFSLPFEGMPDFPEGGTEIGFWEHIADLLEQIETNTRGITVTVEKTGRAPKAERRAIRAVEPPSRKLGKSDLPHSQPNTERVERVPSRRASAPTPPSPTPYPARGQNAPSTYVVRAQRDTRPSGRRSAKPSVALEPTWERMRQAETKGAATPTKSQQEHTRRREETIAREQSKGVLGILKKNLTDWDGSVASPDTGDLQNAAGLAAGGPVWSAIKEVKEAVESSGDDDSSLSGILTKTLADKTGITGAKERLEQAKKTARAKVISWAGGTVDDDEQASQGRDRRDKKGRFLKGEKEAEASQETRIAEESYALATREAAADKKRHDELIEAVKSSGGEGGSGLWGKGGLLDRERGRRRESGRGTGARRRDIGATAGRRNQRTAPGRGRRRGRLGLLAGGLAALGGGAALLSGDPTDLALDLGETALTSPGADRAVSASVGKAAGGLGKAGGAMGKVAGIGAKGALGAAKAIPLAGQLLAAGMAIYDGVQGWNDTTMQQEAFGLADGQEASTGQKASTAAANILDMGGLVSGAAGLLGIDVSTADMAKGIYGIGDSIGSSLSDAWGGITGLFSGDTDAMAKGAGGVAGLAKMANPFTAAFSFFGGDDLLSDAGGSIKSFFGFGEEDQKAATAQKGPHIPLRIDNPMAWDALSYEERGKVLEVEKKYQALQPEPSERKTERASKFESTAQVMTGVADLAKMSNPFMTAFSFFDGDDLLSDVSGSIKSFFGVRGNEKEDTFPTPTKEFFSSRRGQDVALSWEKETGAEEGLFNSLTTALAELTQKIEEEIKGKDQETPGLPASVGGFFSNIFGGKTRRGGEQSGSRNKLPLTTRAIEQAQAINGNQLGALSARYESGRLGSEAIGWDRTGGTSYGKYQIATRTGTMKKFMEYAKERNPEVYARLMAAGPADAGKDGAFAQEWKALAAEGKMGDLEHDFIKSTHFDPAFAGIRDEGLRKRIEGSNALQDVLWSTSVQHGAEGADKLINRIYREGMSDEDFIQALYAERGTQFGSSSAAVQNSVRSRFANERDVALATLQDEKKQTETTKQAANGNEGFARGVREVTKTAGAELVKSPDRAAKPEIQEEKTAVASASAVQSDNAAPQGGTPAAPVQVGERPVQMAAVQELPPQPAPRYPDPEPIQPAPAPNSTGTDVTAQMVALLSQLLEVTKQQVQKQEKATEASNTPNIPMEYDNAYCVSIAHDRA